MEEKEKKTVSLKKHGIVMIIALILQYFLGMASNLFTQFPDIKDAGRLWLYAWSQTSLALHIILGLLLLFGSIILIIRALIKRDFIWIIASVVGFLAIIGSVIAGAIFVTSQSNVYSFAMSVGFIVALLSYFFGVYKSK